MENQTNQTNEVRQVSLDEAQQEVEKIKSKYVRLSQGEAQVLDFTGNTWIREAVFKDKQGNDSPAKMLDFEIDDKLEDGSYRVLSRNIQNSDVPKILRYLKEGRKRLMLSKDAQNKVSVAAVKA